MISPKNNRILFAAGIFGPIFYFLLLTILGLFWSGYNPAFQSMSEIGSVVSPYKDLMNYLGFSLLGVFISIFSIGILKEFGKGLLQYLAFSLILTAGVFMFAVGFFPCDAGCIDVTQTGTLHSFTSTVPSITLPLAAMFMATVFVKRLGKRWGHISFWLGVSSISSGPIMFIPAFAHYLGLVQRIGIGFSLIWMILVSGKMLSLSSTKNFQGEKS